MRAQNLVYITDIGTGFFFSKKLKELGFDVIFFKNITKKFIESDYLFINSRIFPSKDGYVDIDKLKKLKKLIVICTGLICVIAQALLNLKFYHL